MKRICLLLCIALMCFISSALAKQNKEHFEVIESPYTIVGTPVKLDNGNVLIYSKNDFNKYEEFNIIFNPKQKTFSKADFFSDSMNPARNTDSAVLLDSGKVLFMGPWMYYPSLKTGREMLNFMPRGLCPFKLSDNECEKLELPYVKKYPDLYSAYKKDIEYYNQSVYAELFNPQTGKFENTGKMNVRREEFVAAKAKNGRVYIFGGKAERSRDIRIDRTREERARDIEMYDPETGQFSIAGRLNFAPSNKDYFRAFPLGNGKICIIKRSAYMLFNPEDNTVSDEKKLKDAEYQSIAVQLNDDRIVLLNNINKNIDKYKLKNKSKYIKDIKTYTNSWRLEIVVFNPADGSIKYSGNLLVPRDHIEPPELTVLKDNKILVTGGAKYISYGNYDRIISKAEIFNPDTGKSEIIGNLPYVPDSIEYVGYKRPKSVLLDDGRVLLFFDRTNKVMLYTP